jgi:hypothetical protein
MNAVTQTGQVPVSHERHGGRSWRRFTSYAFARSLHCVPVVLAELDPAAASFPVVFAEDAQGMMPVALLHLRRGAASPFVAEDGSWRGTYVPSALRAHPFSASATGAGDEMALLVDEGSGLVTDDPRDEAFFAADGTPSEPLGQVIAFFRTRALSERDTRAACAALDEAGRSAPRRGPAPRPRRRMRPIRACPISCRRSPMRETAKAGRRNEDRAFCHGLGRACRLHRAARSHAGSAQPRTGDRRAARRARAFRPCR